MPATTAAGGSRFWGGFPHVRRFRQQPRPPCGSRPSLAVSMGCLVSPTAAGTVVYSYIFVLGSAPCADLPTLAGRGRSEWLSESEPLTQCARASGGRPSAERYVGERQAAKWPLEGAASGRAAHLVNAVAPATTSWLGAKRVMAILCLPGDGSLHRR